MYISALYVTALCERVHYALRVPTFLATILATTAANGGEIRKRDGIKRNIAKTIINALWLIAFCNTACRNCLNIIEQQ